MEKEQSKKCEICETEATCLCFKCNFYLCDKCYKIIHDLKCSIHKTQQNSLLCLDDKSKKILYIIF